MWSKPALGSMANESLRAWRGCRARRSARPIVCVAVTLRPVPALVVLLVALLHATDAAAAERGKRSPFAAPALAAPNLLAHHGRSIALSGRAFTLRGTTPRSWVGRRVVVRFHHAGRTHARRVFVFPELASNRGGFRVRLRVRGTGVARVTARRDAKRARKARMRIRLARPQLRFRQRGPLVRAVQRRLAALRFAAPQHGRYDRRTALAVLAFRGVNRLGRSVEAGAGVIELLSRGGGAYRPRFARRGRRVEADVTRRVVVLLKGRRVVRVLHTSPGKRATPTILGSFRFYAKRRGYTPTGMLHSNFFLRGYAVHGYEFVPTFPDSHGCLRISNRDALAVFRFIRVGDRIDVFRSQPKRRRSA